VSGSGLFAHRGAFLRGLLRSTNSVEGGGCEQSGRTDTKTKPEKQGIPIDEGGNKDKKTRINEMAKCKKETG